jgi:hypothetical protein
MHRQKKIDANLERKRKDQERLEKANKIEQINLETEINKMNETDISNPLFDGAKKSKDILNFFNYDDDNDTEELTERDDDDVDLNKTMLDQDKSYEEALILEEDDEESELANDDEESDDEEHLDEEDFLPGN